jgi:hypothetical protein
MLYPSIAGFCSKRRDTFPALFFAAYPWLPEAR